MRTLITTDGVARPTLHFHGLAEAQACARADDRVNGLRRREHQRTAQVKEIITTTNKMVLLKL
jgi:hypothetical protein